MPHASGLEYPAGFMNGAYRGFRQPQFSSSL
jgi:hypothetical protein